MPSVLIVGASRGIGLEFARQYAQAGWDVHATYRAQGSVLEGVSNIQTYKLEVTSNDDITALKRALGDTPLDLIVLNAGVYGQDDAFFGHTDEPSWLVAMQINAIAPLKIIEALVDNVAESEEKKIVAMSSKMGSMADNSSGGSYVYRSTKAALNSVIKSMSIDLSHEHEITVLAMHPGWVITDMTGTNALITAQESVASMRTVVERCSSQDGGKFLDYKGTEIAW